MSDEPNPPAGGNPVAGHGFPPPGTGRTPDGYGAETWLGSPAPGGPGPSGSATVRQGIIPLRPLAAGDILDGAFRAVRFNPRTMLGLSFLVSLVSAAVSVGVMVSLDQTTSADAVFRFDPSTVVSLFGTVVLTGLLTHVVAEAVLGRKASIGQTWTTVKGRLLPLIGYQVLALATAVILGVTVVGLLALPLLAYWVLAPPVIVLERQGIRASLRRSIALVRGAFWRTLGILLLTGLILMVASVVLMLPVMLVAGIVVAVVEGGSGSLLLAALLASGATLLASTLLQPFAAAAVVLLYVDRRMRLEGLDVALARNSQGPEASGG